VMMMVMRQPVDLAAPEKEKQMQVVTVEQQVAKRVPR